jgi:two-component system, OmpR family, KDP operon response regulator KdpE
MTENKPLILVIEDDPPIRRFITAALANHGYDVAEAAAGTQAIALAPDRPPELVILDLGLPDMDGLEVIRRLREWLSAPIIVVSARGQEKDKVAALDAGADDYLTKPFGVGELLARLRVALRHHRQAQDAHGRESPLFSVGEINVDLAARRVFKGKAEVHLTPIEYKLLTTLARHAGKVLTHQFLLKEVWGPPYVEQSHYLRIFMTNLRRKLENDPTRPKYLITEQGVGYRLIDEDPAG